MVHGLKCICVWSSKHNSLPQRIFEWVLLFITLVLVQFIKTYSNSSRPIQTLPYVDHSYILEGQGQVTFCRSFNLSVHMLNCACMYKGVQLKSTLQHTGTWLAAAWSPTVCVIVHLHSCASFVSLCLHSHKEKSGLYLKKCCFDFFVHKTEIAWVEIV